MILIDNIFNQNKPNSIIIDDIHKDYGRILILCLKNTKLDQDIKNIINYTLIPVSTNIIKNSIFLDSLQVQSYEFLSKYFNIDRKFFTQVDQNELILNFSNINEEKIKNFLLQFNGVCNFENYIFLKLVNDYMASEYNDDKILINKINILQTINERTYWALKFNCKLNISLSFINREFNLSTTNQIKDEYVRGILNKISSADCDNYLAHIYRKQLYVDASSNLNNKGYKLYRITTHSIYEHMNIETFSKFIQESKIIESPEFYYLVMNLLSSKELCHYIINNKYILEILIDTKFISKYYFVFKYLFSYAWLTFYMEESIKKKHINKDDRFIFDIDTANLLPNLPIDYTISNFNSPYLPILINKELYDIHNNIMGTCLVYDEKIKYGICNLQTFKFRLNLFCSGINKDIFENLNFDNIALSGSLIACCLPNFNPIMLNCIDINNFNPEDFIFYINEYYRDSDIDIMCNLNGLEFIDKVYSIKSCIEQNIEHEINIKSIKLLTVFINNEFIKTHLNDFTDIKNINSQDIKNIIYPMYCEYKKNKEINNIITNNKYLDEINLASIEDMQIILNQNNENIISFSENLKYKLSSPLLPRTIEIFKIKYNDFFSTVSAFHLPIVRGYYDGNTVKMTPTCISACFTMINIDYKYFAGSKDPIEIINKYRCRGFGTILNDKEKLRYIQYNKLNEKWNKIFYSNSLGFKNYTDVIFKYSHYIYNEKTKYITYNINFVSNIVASSYDNKIYEKIYNFSTKYEDIYNSLICINKYGYIEPLKHYIIDFNFHNELILNVN